MAHGRKSKTNVRFVIKMNFSPLQKLISTIILALLIMGTAAKLYGMLVANITAMNEKNSMLENKIANSEEDQRHAHTLSVLFESRKDAIERIKQIFVNRERPVAFLDDLTSLGNNTGNKIALDYLENESTEALLSFRLTVEGTEGTIIKFLRILELSPYSVAIQELNWEKLNEENVSRNAPPVPPIRLTLRLTVAVRTRFRSRSLHLVQYLIPPSAPLRTGSDPLLLLEKREVMSLCSKPSNAAAKSRQLLGRGPAPGRDQGRGWAEGGEPRLGSPEPNSGMTSSFASGAGQRHVRRRRRRGGVRCG